MASIHWHEIPFVRICIPFILGILIQQETGSSVSMTYGIPLTLGLFLCAFLTKNSQCKQLLRTGVICLLVFTIGALMCSSVEPSHREIERLSSYNALVSATVRSATSTDYGHKARLTLNPPVTYQRNIQVIAYIRDSTTTLLPGDTLFFSGGLRHIDPPDNPYAFDAAKFYQRQGIHLKAVLDSSDIASHPYRGSFHLIRTSVEIREALKAICQQYVRNAQSCAVLLAMTIGITEGLDESIYDAYAKTGTIHVLSISGLHVGIVSVLLFLLVGRVRSSDKTGVKVLRIAILLTGIWTFAFIAGLSPSITRASLMSAIYLVGIVLRRPTKGLNVMAFTAFVCLSIDPLQVNSLSFQFSYLALCGILIFYKPLYQLIAVRSFPGKFIWSTIVLSITAQILLLPLLVHYFQQISIISIFSSLIAIPASYGILIGGILILILHFLLPAGAGIVGLILDYGIRTVNETIIGMSTLPLSHLSHVYLPPVEIVVLSVITLLLSLRILTQRKYWTYLTVSGVVYFGVLHIAMLEGTKKNALLAIYPYPAQLAIDYIAGNNCYTTFDIQSMSKYQIEEITAFRNASIVRQIQPLILDSLSTTRQVQVFDLPAQDNRISHGGNYRIAVITESETELLNCELLNLRADCIILASGLSYSMRQTSEAFFIQHQQTFHDLREKGTFYLSLQKNNNSNETQWRHFSG